MKIDTEHGSHDIKDESCLGKCLHAKKEKGIKIDAQALAICFSECHQNKKTEQSSLGAHDVSRPDSDFAYVPKDSKSAKSERKLPIFDADHVRNALARLSQTEGIPNDQKDEVKHKLCKAAKKFNIETDLCSKKTEQSGSELENGNFNFSILGHWKENNLNYELQILQNDKIIAFPFKSSNAPRPSEPIHTLMSAKNITCKCLGGIGDVPGSRLVGEFSSFERDPSWLNFEGVTKSTKEVYLPLIKGKVEIKNTENSTELIFDSKELSGRWLMRNLPNVFDKIVDGEKMNLLWKPDTVESLLTKPEVSGETSKKESLMSVEVEKIGPSEFEVTLAAEGTWTDRFGQKFVYTKEFINTLYTNMNMQVLDGRVPLGVDKEHSKIDNGRITNLELLDQPIARIKGRGYFNGPIEDVKGASIDAEFDVFFQKELQSWIPVNGITKRVSLVANPACKVCYFTPKAG